jgi:hypothetical protein
VSCLGSEERSHLTGTAGDISGASWHLEVLISFMIISRTELWMCVTTNSDTKEIVIGCNMICI